MDDEAEAMRPMSTWRLATQRQWVGPLWSVLEDVAAEGDISIEPVKELAYFRSGKRGHFAVVDDGNQVVGYLSGSMRNGKSGKHVVAEEEVVAYIRLVAIHPEHRGEGAGYEAIRSFAHHAREADSATILTLELDGGGDRARRRGRFERMGFTFLSDVGLARIDDLVSAGP